MIVFKKLRAKNFMSVGNQWIEYDLDKHKTTYIYGANGSGKSSTLTDTITFGLFNKPFRKVKLGQLVNSINGRDMVVEIEFTINSNNYKIIRGYTPSIFEIHINGELLNQDSSSKDYQNILEEQILKMNFKTFTQIVILGSASYVPFMKLPLGSRRDIIEDLLDINVFSLMNKILKEERTEQYNTLQTYNHSLDTLNQAYDLKSEHYKSSVSEMKDSINDLDRKISEYANYQNEILKLIKSFEDRIGEIGYDVKIRDELLLTIDKLIEYKIKIEQNLKRLNRDLKFFTDNDTCSKCDQKISEEYKKTKQNSFDEKIKNFISGLLKLEKDLSFHRENLFRLDEKKKIISSINVNISTEKQKLVIGEDHIKYLYDEKDSLTKKKKEKKVDKKELESIKKDITEIKEKLNDILYDKKPIMDVAFELLKDNGIKTRIIKYYLPIINFYVNSFLEKLSFIVNFEFDESFVETIRSRYRDEFSYYNFSEGERARINLALLFTWREIVKMKKMSATNLLIFDEIFDGSLDSMGTVDFLEILGTLDPHTNSFIISHKQEASNVNFNCIVEAVKTGNFTELKKTC